MIGLATMTISGVGEGHTVARADGAATIEQFVMTACVDCHHGPAAEAGLDLKPLPCRIVRMAGLRSATEVICVPELTSNRRVWRGCTARNPDIE